MGARGVYVSPALTTICGRCMNVKGWAVSGNDVLMVGERLDWLRVIWAASCWRHLLRMSAKIER
jgi:hypothetical protein